MDTIFLLKVAQDPRLHFCQKSWKKSTSWFFSKPVLKNAIFECFLSLILYIPGVRPNTESYIVRTVDMLHYSLKVTSKLFPYFLGKEGDF